MSQQGRCNALVAAAAAVLCAAVLLRIEVAQAATFTVGDTGGWTFGVQNWPNGKTFRAGDILVFNYMPGMHTVVEVDKAGYDSCKIPANAKVFSSGKDRITLVKGGNYFICGIPGHCQAGMKIAVIAN
ncbi:Chemocyanin like [Actinidia chinensis var. chinensis]|uniref:Basic blue protein n=1 Tax=Actinidia chinensis var. chinensis TaxID=1590841 RepID=A0A2R6RGL0_ACTCC|nr:Chemocyanin like [Actinidia chinensis var. chinensis]